MKRRLPSESDSLPLPDVETAPPPEQYIIRDQSDLESDIPEMEDLTAGACVKTMSSCVKPVSPCVKSESTVEGNVSTNPVVSKATLLSQVMKANEEMMKRMMAQNQSVLMQNQNMMAQNQLMTERLLAQIERM